ncbi:MAG: hypothetical protein QOI99_1152, partial [Actinomycetota bacterium]|nr:hypothetical protein [Actinomycetota bacterium]
VEQNVTLARRLSDRVLHMHDGWLAAEPAAEASPA